MSTDEELGAKIPSWMPGLKLRHVQLSRKTKSGADNL